LGSGRNDFFFGNVTELDSACWPTITMLLGGNEISLNICSEVLAGILACSESLQAPHYSGEPHFGRHVCFSADVFKTDQKKIKELDFILSYRLFVIAFA